MEVRNPTYRGEIVLGAESDAVPKARRFAVQALPELTGEPLDDVRLLVTELVTNAVFHAGAPVKVRIRRLPASVRIEVEDTGRGVPVRALHSEGQMTGRGLALVSALSTAWGVDRLPTGSKVVWATVSEAVDTEDSVVELAAERALPHLYGETNDVGERLHEVRLGSVPTDLLLDAKRHLDNVVRELTLAKSAELASGVSLPEPMSNLITSVMTDFADARTEIKLQALAAAADGEPLTELVLRLPLSAADAGERYLEALDLADRYALAARLLTLSAPRSHQDFRRWYVQALVDQLRAVSLDMEAPPVEPFSARNVENTTNRRIGTADC